jgi:hypothetical protein
MLFGGWSTTVLESEPQNDGGNNRELLHGCLRIVDDRYRAVFHDFFHNMAAGSGKARAFRLVGSTVQDFGAMGPRGFELYDYRKKNWGGMESRTHRACAFLSLIASCAAVAGTSPAAVAATTPEDPVSLNNLGSRLYAAGQYRRTVPRAPMP